MSSQYQKSTHLHQYSLICAKFPRRQLSASSYKRLWMNGFCHACAVNLINVSTIHRRDVRSTTLALVDLLHHWSKALDERKSVRALFVDYAKAFDHVDHGTVLRKLHSYDVPSFVINWLVSFLQERQQRVKIGDVLSEWVTLCGEMPQGSWLGPLVFLILTELQALTQKYVDDTTISEVVTKDESSQMQSVVDELVNWSAT